MIDRALDFLVPFFAVTTICFGALGFGVWLWTMLPTIAAWVQSSYVAAAFWLSACGFAFSLAISIARH